MLGATTLGFADIQATALIALVALMAILRT
jgi:hypothetical protein